MTAEQMKEALKKSMQSAVNELEENRRNLMK
jgi:hypothetical protein